MQHLMLCMYRSEGRSYYGGIELKRDDHLLILSFQLASLQRFLSILWFQPGEGMDITQESINLIVLGYTDGWDKLDVFSLKMEQGEIIVAVATGIWD